MFKAKERKATGIYVVGPKLHIVELCRRGGQIFLLKLVERALDSQIETAPLASEPWRRCLVEGLRQAASQELLDYTNPILGLDDRAVVLKRRPLVGESEKANREHLLWEAEQFLPSTVDQYGIDIVSTAYYGFVVAVQRNLLNQYMALCSDAGLQDPVFDIAPFAFYNALDASGQLDRDRLQLVIDVSCWAAQVLLLQGEQLRGVSSCLWEEDADGDASRLKALMDMLENWLKEEMGDERPQRIWLGGTGANEAFWLREIKNHLSVSSEFLEPFKGINTSPLTGTTAPHLQKSSTFAVAAGLAYRGLLAG